MIETEWSSFRHSGEFFTLSSTTAVACDKSEICLFCLHIHRKRGEVLLAQKKTWTVFCLVLLRGNKKTAVAITERHCQPTFFLRLNVNVSWRILAKNWSWHWKFYVVQWRDRLARNEAYFHVQSQRRFFNMIARLPVAKLGKTTMRGNSVFAFFCCLPRPFHLRTC